MGQPSTADEWISRAIERAEGAVLALKTAMHTTGPTGDTLRYSYSQLFAASEHLRDAGFAAGIGEVK